MTEEEERITKLRAESVKATLEEPVVSATTFNLEHGERNKSRWDSSGLTMYYARARCCYLRGSGYGFCRVARLETSLVWLLVLLLSSPAAFAQRVVNANPTTADQLSPGLIEGVRQYLTSQQDSPEEYLVRQFANHDIIFLGEMHGVRQNLEFLQRLIPRLYTAGVYNLGYEFSRYKDQAKIDRLLSLPSYDPRIANDLLSEIDLTYVTQEYTDVYKVAWELNHRLPPGARRFRIVALNIDESGQTPADAWGGQRLNIHDQTNIFWAQVISKEFLANHEKALIYSGSGHSFTRFFFQRKQDHSFSAGNLVHNFIPNRVMTVWLHGDVERKALTRQIDELVEASNGVDRPRAFDTQSTPFGTLPLAISGYVFGKQNCGPFTLADVADGYIWLARRTDLTGVRFIKRFITPANIARIEFRWRKEHPRSRAYTKEELEEAAADNWQHLQEAWQ